MAREPLTTPQTERVTQWELTAFNADLDTGFFTVRLRLTDDTGLIVREREFGGRLAELGLATATVLDIRQRLKAFLVIREAVT